MVAALCRSVCMVRPVRLSFARFAMLVEGESSWGGQTLCADDGWQFTGHPIVSSHATTPRREIFDPKVLLSFVAPLTLVELLPCACQCLRPSLQSFWGE